MRQCGRAGTHTRHPRELPERSGTASRRRCTPPIPPPNPTRQHTLRARIVFAGGLRGGHAQGAQGREPNCDKKPHAVAGRATITGRTIIDRRHMARVRTTDPHQNSKTTAATTSRWPREPQRLRPQQRGQWRQERTQEPQTAHSSEPKQPAWKKRGTAAHPKSSSRSSLSINVGVACAISRCWDALACVLKRAGEKRGEGNRVTEWESGSSSSWGEGDGVVDECRPGIRCVPNRCGPGTCSRVGAPLSSRPGSGRPPGNVPAPLPAQPRWVWPGP